MKKAIVLLLALALIGGFAFAEDAAAAPAAPAPTMVQAVEPVITYGLTGSFGTDAAMANQQLEFNAADAHVSAVSRAVIGFDYGNGQTFKVEPWAKVTAGSFWVKGTVGYKASRYSSAVAAGKFVQETGINEDSIVKLATGVTKDGLTISNTFVIDKNNYADNSTDYTFPFTNNSLGANAMYNLFSAAVTKDNLEGALDFATNMNAATHVTAFGDIFYAFNNQVLYDWYFKISNLFGMMNVTVGGQDNNYSYNFRPYGMYPSTAVIYYQTTARSGTGLFFSGDDLNIIPVYTEYDLSKWVPLYIQTGVKVPGQTLTQNGANVTDTQMIGTWLSGSNLWLAAKYTVKDIGDFQLGLIPNLPTDYKTIAAAVGTLGDRALAIGNYYYNASSAVASTIFGDFNISAVKNLTARVSFDAKFGQKVNKTAGSTTGTGTAADPFKPAYYSYSVINFGLEGKYMLDDVLKGLAAYVGVYGGMASGQTTLNSTGTAWAAATSAQLFTSNYDEATVNAKALGANPFILSLRGTYTLANKDSCYVENIFTNTAGALKTTNITTTGATKVASGYYSSDTINLNYTAMAGVGKLAITPSYTLYMGVPSAADLGITDADQAAAYSESVADQYAPWGIALTYTASF